MTLQEIESLMRSGGDVQLEIHAVDAAIYLVFQRFGERLTPVSNAGTQLSYSSRYAALKALAEAGVPAVDFVHRSAYGEMIGMETPHDATEMRQTVDLKSYQ